MSQMRRTADSATIFERPYALVSYRLIGLSYALNLLITYTATVALLTLTTT
jgi:hypothetical protein